MAPAAWSISEHTGSTGLTFSACLQSAAHAADAQHQSHIVAELDRYAALQRTMAQAKEAFQQEKEQMAQERQAALDAAARDFQGQLQVRSWGP